MPSPDTRGLRFNNATFFNGENSAQSNDSESKSEVTCEQQLYIRLSDWCSLCVVYFQFVYCLCVVCVLLVFLCVVYEFLHVVCVLFVQTHSQVHAQADAYTHAYDATIQPYRPVRSMKGLFD